MSLSFHLCLFLCFLLLLSFYRLPPLSFFVCCSLPPFRSASLFLSFNSFSLYLSLTFFVSSETYEIRTYFSRATLVEVSKSALFCCKYRHYAFECVEVHCERKRVLNFFNAHVLPKRFCQDNKTPRQ